MVGAGTMFHFLTLHRIRHHRELRPLTYRSWCVCLHVVGDASASDMRVMPLIKPIAEAMN
jgi:hypothetical protein